MIDWRKYHDTQKKPFFSSFLFFSFFFFQAACHREDVIAKKAIEHIHGIVAAFLQNTSEQPYFHFNESLFKPFENLVCLELCDSDIQDQVRVAAAR